MNFSTHGSKYFHLHKFQTSRGVDLGSSRRFCSTEINLNASMGKTLYNSNPDKKRKITHAISTQVRAFPSQEVLSIDLMQLLRSQDFSQVERLLGRLIYCKFEHENEDLTLLVTNFQQILEYLFKIQVNLDQEGRFIEDKLNSEHIPIRDTLEKRIMENKAVIRVNRSRNKSMQNKIILYKNIIQQTGYKDNNNNTKIISGSTVIQDKQYYYCDICECKRFLSYDRLHAHYVRRHLKTDNTTVLVQSNPQEKLMAKNISTMKDDLMSSLENFKTKNMSELTESHVILQKKIEEIKYKADNENVVKLNGIKNEFSRILQELQRIKSEPNNNANPINEKDLVAVFEYYKKTQEKQIEKITSQIQNFEVDMKNEIRNYSIKKSDNVGESQPFKMQPLKPIQNSNFEIIPHEDKNDAKKVLPPKREKIKVYEQLRAREEPKKEEEPIAIHQELHEEIQPIEEKKPIEPLGKEKPEIIVESGGNDLLMDVYNKFITRDQNVLFTTNDDLDIIEHYPIFKINTVDRSIVSQRIEKSFKNYSQLNFTQLDKLLQHDVASYAQLIKKIVKNSSEMGKDPKKKYSQYKDNLYNLLDIDNILNSKESVLHRAQINLQKEREMIKEQKKNEEEKEKEKEGVIINTKGTGEFNYA